MSGVTLLVREHTIDPWIINEVLSGVYTSALFPQEGDTVLDCGAHIGSFSLLASFMVGNSGKVIAFEPHPDNFNMLVENLRINGITNVEAYNLAVSNFDGYSYVTNKLGWNTGMVTIQTMGGICVQTVSLDNLITEKVDFIKLDVEGSELYVLEGAVNLLLQNSPKIVGEIHNKHIMSAVKQFLGSIGYNCVFTKYCHFMYLINSWR